MPRSSRRPATPFPLAGPMPGGVRRLNRLPLALVGGVLLLVVGTIGYTLSTRQQTPGPVTAMAGAFAPEGAAPPTLAANPFDPAFNGRSASPGQAMSPPPAATPTPAAVTGVDVWGPAASTPPADDPAWSAPAVQDTPPSQSASDAENARKEALNATTTVYANDRPAAADSPAPGAAGAQGGKAGFFNQPGEASNALSSRLTPQASPYELKAGTVIPSVMISGINSDLPGQLLAQVAENVYDSATGRHLLVPQGTKLIGIYENNVAMGQSRVLIAWTRLIYPDGASLDLGRMPGQDTQGYGGFHDRVNNHTARVAGQAVILSLITAGAQLSQPLPRRGDDAASFSYPQIMASSLGLQLNQLGMEVLRKGMSISPTLTIRPGYAFNVMVTKDITLTPWRGR